MLIKALMLSNEDLITVGPEDSVEIALNKILEKNFLSIPVVEGKNFLGVIAKERIFSDYFQDTINKEEFLAKKVKDFLRRDIPTLRPQDEIEKASHTLEVYGVPFVAVVNDEGNFEGIITHYTIFREFADILGLNRGKRLAVIAYDIPGQIAKLTDIINRCGGDIISFVVIDPKVKTDVREVVVRLRAENYMQIVDAVKDAGFRIQ